MAGRLHRTRLYRRNRREILRGGPLCALCRTARATTADFIIPESKGGTPSLGNLRPACHSCNSSRGNRTLTRDGVKW